MRSAINAQHILRNKFTQFTFSFKVDQDNNANRLEQIGVGITFDITDFTSESLQAGINELISNSS